VTRGEYVDLLKMDEGFRAEVYLDTEGIPTCGWGHALHIGSPVSLRICELFFEADLERVERDFAALKLPEMDSVRAYIVRCMLFQMGLKGVRGFKKFLAALRKNDWTEASLQMLDSKWANQTPKRARRLAFMMLTGRRKG
jgi:lysozyme